MELNADTAYRHNSLIPQEFAQMDSGLVQAATGLAQAAAGLAEAARVMQIAASAHFLAHQQFHSEQQQQRQQMRSSCWPSNFFMPHSPTPDIAVSKFTPTMNDWAETPTVTKPITDENPSIEAQTLILSEQFLASTTAEDYVECVEATDNAEETVQCIETLESSEEIALQSNVHPEADPQQEQTNRRASKKRAAKKKKHAYKASNANNVSSDTNGERYDQRRHAASESGNEDSEKQHEALPAEDARKSLQLCNDKSMHASDELPSSLRDVTPLQSPKQRKKSKSTASGGKNIFSARSEVEATIESAQVLEKVQKALRVLSLDNFEHIENELKKVDITADGAVETVVDMVFDAACSDIAAIGLCAQLICSMMLVGPMGDIADENIRIRVRQRIEQAFCDFFTAHIVPENERAVLSEKQDLISHRSTSVVNDIFEGTIRLAGQLYVVQNYRDQIFSPKNLLNYLEQLMPIANSCDFVAGRCTAFAILKLAVSCDLIMDVGHVLAVEGGNLNAEPWRILNRFEWLRGRQAVDMGLQKRMEEVFEWHKLGWDPALAHTCVTRKFDSHGRYVRCGRLPIYMPTAENVASPITNESLPLVLSEEVPRMPLRQEIVECVEANTEIFVEKITVTLVDPQQQTSKSQQPHPKKLPKSEKKKNACKTAADDDVLDAASKENNRSPRVSGNESSSPPLYDDENEVSRQLSDSKAKSLRNFRERMLRGLLLDEQFELSTDIGGYFHNGVKQRKPDPDKGYGKFHIFNLQHYMLKDLRKAMHTLSPANFNGVVRQLDCILTEWYSDDMLEFVVDIIFETACFWERTSGLCAELIAFLMTFGPIDGNAEKCVYKLVREQLMRKFEEKFMRLEDLDETKRWGIDNPKGAWVLIGLEGVVQFVGQLYVVQSFADQIISIGKLLQYMERLLPTAGSKRDFLCDRIFTEFAEQKLKWLCELVMNVGHVLASEADGVIRSLRRILTILNGLCDERNAIVSCKLQSAMQKAIQWHNSGWDPALADECWLEKSMVKKPKVAIIDGVSNVNYRLII